MNLVDRIIFAVTCAALITLLLILWIAPLRAAEPTVPICAARDQLVHILEQRHGETLLARGLMDTGVLMELFARPDGETWTLLATGTSGSSCLVASGEAWQTLPATLPGRRS